MRNTRLHPAAERHAALMLLIYMALVVLLTLLTARAAGG